MRWSLLKPTVFVLSLLPLVWLAGRGVTNHLGANPIEAITRFLGDWALRFLLIALAVTPLNKLTGWSQLARVRRMTGLFAFFYVTLHLLAYVGLDRFFDFSAIYQDIVRRNFITVGMLAYVLLIPLAATSTNAMVKRLGGRNWKRLHKLVYLIAPLGVLHYYWMTKADKSQPLLYAALVVVLLGIRLVLRYRLKPSNQP